MPASSAIPVPALGRGEGLAHAFDLPTALPPSASARASSAPSLNTAARPRHRSKPHPMKEADGVVEDAGTGAGHARRPIVKNVPCYDAIRYSPGVICNGVGLPADDVSKMPTRLGAHFEVMALIPKK